MEHASLEKNCVPAVRQLAVKEWRQPAHEAHLNEVMELWLNYNCISLNSTYKKNKTFQKQEPGAGRLAKSLCLPANIGQSMELFGRAKKIIIQKEKQRSIIGLVHSRPILDHVSVL